MVGPSFEALVGTLTQDSQLSVFQQVFPKCIAKHVRPQPPRARSRRGVCLLQRVNLGARAHQKTLSQTSCFQWSMLREHLMNFKSSLSCSGLVCQLGLPEVGLGFCSPATPYVPFPPLPHCLPCPQPVVFVSSNGDDTIDAMCSNSK